MRGDGAGCEQVEYANCLRDAEGPELPTHCLEIIAERVDPWLPKDVNEYGTASAVADWMDLDSVPAIR